MKYKDIILRLRAEGKTYDEIRRITGASKGTIAYHCGVGQKEKAFKRRRKNRSKQHPFCRKVENFLIIRSREELKSEKRFNSEKVRLKIKTEAFHRERGKNYNMYKKPSFNSQDVIDRFGLKPKCYLTGVEIDIYKTSSYHFDHIIPVSKGGESTIDNLGICTRDANQAKNDMLLEDFLLLCKQVLENRGYVISLKEAPQPEFESGTSGVGNRHSAN